MLKKIFTLISFCFFTIAVTQSQIVTFNFFGLSSPPTANSVSTNPNISSPVVLSRGSGAVANAATNSFRTTGFQNNGISIANTDYFEFTVTANTGFTLNPTGITATFSGTTTFAAAPGVTHNFAYSISGGTFTFVNADVVTIGNGTANFPFSVATTAALSGLNAGTNITFRYYASGQTATGGWGFISASATTQNMTLNGTVTSVLPVSISKLNASKASDNKIKLNWAMGCTATALTYSIERSANGITFNSIFSETVSKQRCGLPFDFTDNQPLKGNNFYRIKSFDTDGELKYSDIAKVKSTGNSSFEVSPTITSSSVNLSFNAEEAGKITIQVIDASGRNVKTIQWNNLIGTNRLQLDLSGLANGQYYINLNRNAVRLATQTVIKM